MNVAIPEPAWTLPHRAGTPFGVSAHVAISVISERSL